MPWQGQKDNIIDRFDARAHLDFIPPPPPPNTSDPNSTTTDELMTSEERQTNYERFRILAQNEFLGITEEKFLQQLHLEEQYGVNAQQEAERVAAKKAQKSGQTGAAIGYTYEDSTGDYPRPAATGSASYNRRGASPPAEDSDSDSDVDVDVCININKLDVTQGNELNKFGRGYGMLSNDFYSFLTRDADEAESLRLAREEEQEKVLMGGRKSRRERRAQREKKFTKRFQSPPSYASREEDFRDLVSAADAQKRQDTATENESRSPSPVNSGVITYITSFGGEDETPGGSATAQVTKAKNQTMSKLQQLKSQLTLGSIIGEKREEMQAKERMAGYKGTPSKEATTRSRKPQVDIVAKPLLYRRNASKSRSRSRSRGGRRDRYQRSSDRSRSRSRSISSSSSRDNRSRHRRDDHSRRRKHSNSRRRSVDRRRQSSSYSPRRRRSSDSSSRSSRSSSSSTSYERRRKGRKSTTPQKQKSRSRDLPKESIVVEATTTVPVKATVEITAPVVEVPVPKPAVAPPPPQICLTPEVQVPVKKYYGRRKEDHSDSELSYSEDETTEKKSSKEPLQKSLSYQRNDSKA